MKRVMLVVLALAIPPLAGFDCTVTATADWAVGGDCGYWLQYDTSVCSGDDILYCGDDNYVYEANCAAQCPNMQGSCGYAEELGKDACICQTTLPAVGQQCDWEVFYPSYNTCLSASRYLDYCDPMLDTVVQVDCSAVCQDGFCGLDTQTNSFACMCPERVWAAGYACTYLTEYDDGVCAADNLNLTYCAEDNNIYDIDCNSHCQADPYFATSGSCGTLSNANYNGCNCEYAAACDFAPYCYDFQFMVQCNPSVGSEWVDCDSYCRTEVGVSKGVCANDGTEANCKCSES